MKFCSQLVGVVIVGWIFNGILHAQQIAPPKRTNVLMIVADDMNWDSPGCFGGIAADATPRIDQLAEQGMRFEHAYVNVSICTPSRSVMLSGLYPSNNGAEGFQRIHSHLETLPARLNKAGYLCGIIGKPLRQQDLFRWSVTYRWQGTGDENRWGRDPHVYRRFVRDFFAMTKTSQQPFFLMVNSHDPHRPFAGGNTTEKLDERVPASRTFTADEVRVPGFLPDLPKVREELAEYCTSVRRLDDMVGAVLDELQQAQLADETIVVFLSDHGMPFPGAKFNCYVNSVRTPLIIRWPGKIERGTIDREHMVAAIDLMPTILDAIGLPQSESDGRSFLPVLLGEKQSHRDCIFAQFYHIHGNDALPMRSVLTRQSAYVFNPWANGERLFTRLEGTTFQAMQRAANTDPEMAARLYDLQYRSVEEFFDLRDDPNCLRNLLGTNSNEPSLAATQQTELNQLREKLRAWMVQVSDPALPAFDNRHHAESMEQFIQEYRNSAAKEVEAQKEYEREQGYTF